MDDLIDADFGKHDYDWLLTPPETPPVPSSGGKDQQITLTVSRGGSTRSVSTARASRDIKQSVGGIRGTSLIPRSIRSNSRPRRISDPVVPVGADEEVATRGSAIASPAGDKSASDHSPQQAPPLISRENNPDIYGSTRYDAMLLREDSNSLNWLHGAEDKSDQYPEFVDHGFEPLPEPFGSL